jgi:hypothetical protein
VNSPDVSATNLDPDILYAYSDLPAWLNAVWTCFLANGEGARWLLHVGTSAVRPGKELKGTGVMFPTRSFMGRPSAGWAWSSHPTRAW